MSARPVKLYDQETGEVTGHTSLAEAQAGLLRTLEIEIDVADGVRPKTVICKNCGRSLPMSAERSSFE
jgi:hypothetical protein